MTFTEVNFTRNIWSDLQILAGCLFPLQLEREITARSVLNPPVEQFFFSENSRRTVRMGLVKRIGWMESSCPDFWPLRDVWFSVLKRTKSSNWREYFLDELIQKKYPDETRFSFVRVLPPRSPCHLAAESVVVFLYFSFNSWFIWEDKSGLKILSIFVSKLELASNSF